MLDLPVPSQVKEAISVLEREGFKAYIVGACVRELLMGGSPVDYDIITNADVEEIQYAFRRYRVSAAKAAIGDIFVTVVGMTILVSPYRRSIIGKRVVYADDILVDLIRRGFTLNAIAYNPRKGLIDPFNGALSIKNDTAVVAAIGGELAERAGFSENSCFSENPRRIFEALKYVARDNYTIEPHTKELINQNINVLDYEDKRLIKAELSKILLGRYAAKALEENSNVFAKLFPAFEKTIGFDQKSKNHEYDLWTHTAKAVGAASPVLEVRYALLFHDVGKPDCFSLAPSGEGRYIGHEERSSLLAEEALRLLGHERKFINEVSALIKAHHLEIDDNPPEIKRILRYFGEDFTRKLVQLQIGDNRGKSERGSTRTEPLRDALNTLNNVIASKECYDTNMLAITANDLVRARLVKPENADALVELLLQRVIDFPAMNARSLLLEMAKKAVSPQK